MHPALQIQTALITQLYLHSCLQPLYVAANVQLHTVGSDIMLVAQSSTVEVDAFAAEQGQPQSVSSLAFTGCFQGTSCHSTATDACQAAA